MVTTGQETPSTNKPLREDVYKKVMSGAPVAARLPRAILTKMSPFQDGSVWSGDEPNHEVRWVYGRHFPFVKETVTCYQL